MRLLENPCVSHRCKPDPGVFYFGGECSRNRNDLLAATFVELGPPSDRGWVGIAGAPGFILSSLPWNYDTYTWHTNRDTFDKISFDDVKLNATFIAMLTYLASEDVVKMPRK